MNICVYGAASSAIDPSYIKETERLGRCLAKRGHSLIFGGGANGLMGAVARGVTAENGRIVSVVPSFFNVDGVLYEKHTEPIVYTETMRERKQTMEERSDGFVMTPGGVGTLDEFFEILTLRHLERHPKPVAVYNVNGYFDDLLSWLHKAKEQGFIGEDCFSVFGIFSDPEELIDYLESLA